MEAQHTLVVAFESGKEPTYGAGDMVLGGRLMAVDFSGDRLAVIDDLLEIARRTEAMLTRHCWQDDTDDPESQLLRDCRAAIAKATQSGKVAA